MSIVYRRRVEDLTALDEEIESAIAEGPEMIALERGGRPAPLNASKPERRI